MTNEIKHWTYGRITYHWWDECITFLRQKLTDEDFAKWADMYCMYINRKI